MIFLSYMRENQADVLLVRRNFAYNGLEAWMDVADILGGTAWETTIFQKISEASASIIFFSSAFASASPRFFEREVDALSKRRADSQSFLIVPVRVDDSPIVTRSIDVGLSFADLQWIDMFGNHRQHGLTKLHQAFGVQNPQLVYTPQAEVEFVRTDTKICPVTIILDGREMLTLGSGESKVLLVAPGPVTMRARTYSSYERYAHQGGTSYHVTYGASPDTRLRLLGFSRYRVRIDGEQIQQGEHMENLVSMFFPAKYKDESKWGNEIKLQVEHIG